MLKPYDDERRQHEGQPLATELDGLGITTVNDDGLQKEGPQSQPVALNIERIAWPAATDEGRHD